MIPGCSQPCLLPQPDLQSYCKVSSHLLPQLCSQDLQLRSRKSLQPYANPATALSLTYGLLPELYHLGGHQWCRWLSTVLDNLDATISIQALQSNGHLVDMMQEVTLAHKQLEFARFWPGVLGHQVVSGCGPEERWLMCRRHMRSST